MGLVTTVLFLPASIQRGKDLEAAHAQLIKNIEERRVEIENLRRELDQLNVEVRNYTSANADLEYQINELKRHIDVLTRQNADLNVELDQILNKNQEIQDELNRMKTIADKQKENEQSLLKSLATLQIAKNRDEREAKEAKDSSKPKPKSKALK